MSAVINIDDYYKTDSDWLSAADLPQGKEARATISEIVEVTFKPGEPAKLGMKFKGKEKGVVLNKTNAKRIAHVYGPSTGAWIGKEIFLYTELVEFQGKEMLGIRVRVPMPEDDSPIPGWD